jgi:DNA-binding CsgD family transcriptional regulator
MRPRNQSARVMKLDKSMHHLTPRDKRLLRRLAQGKTDVEIAKEMGCKEHHISTHRQRIVENLQITSHEQLVVMTHQFAPWPARSSKDRL